PAGGQQRFDLVVAELGPRNPGRTGGVRRRWFVIPRAYHHGGGKNPRSRGCSGAGVLASDGELKGSQESFQVLPLAVGEIDVEAALVILDGRLDVLGLTVVEIRSAGREAAQRRHAELREVG